MTNENKRMNFLIYHNENEDVSVNAVIKDETIWLTQKAMAELFDVNVPAISKHLSNIYAEEELLKEATISEMETVQQEGNRQVSRIQTFYNLNAIISVGYRVKSFLTHSLQCCDIIYDTKKEEYEHHQ